MADTLSETGPTLDITAPLAFNDWLAEQRVSLAFSTYQTGTLFAVGLDSCGRLAVDSIHLKRCMGLWVENLGRTVLVGAQDQIWRFDNILPPGQSHEGHDGIYAPETAWTTGDLDTHDLARDGRGRVLFVNTRYSCLAAASEDHHFAPVWRPPFVTELAPGDRCHLNGLAVRDGRPAFVTVLARTDTPQGWREHKRDGGAVIETTTGECVVAGLSMPHSPRWYRESLWLLESGTGQFGRVDADAGRFEPLCFCPGYPRGLAFYGDFALIGLSLPRENSGFGGLPLDEALRRRNAAPCCGLLVVDLRRGSPLFSVTMEGSVQELYDVAVLPGVRRPRWIGLDSEDLHFLLRIGPAEPLFYGKLG
jgi:uncharacterized protein (TIGR03032 family)